MKRELERIMEKARLGGLDGTGEFLKKAKSRKYSDTSIAESLVCSQEFLQAFFGDDFVNATTRPMPLKKGGKDHIDVEVILHYGSAWRFHAHEFLNVILRKEDPIAFLLTFCEKEK